MQREPGAREREAQQEPASVYANRGVLPRLDLSLGYAF